MSSSPTSALANATRHPLRTYLRIGMWTGGLVAVSNIVSLATTNDSYHHDAASLAGALAAKSAYYGLLWPTALLAAWKSPRELLVLGRGREYSGRGLRGRKGGFAKKKRALAL